MTRSGRASEGSWRAALGRGLAGCPRRPSPGLGGPLAFFVFAALGILAAAPGRAAAAETAAPAGPYQVAWLTLEKAWSGGTTIPLFVGFRGGKASAAWICSPAKGKGYNIQTHKWRGLNPTVYVHQGTVFHIGYAGYVMALDAKTGAVRWEYTKLFKAQAGTDPYGKGGAGVSCAGPIVVDGKAIVSRHETVALDPATGRELWKTRGGNLNRWTHQGKEYLVVSWSADKGATSGGSMVDPSTGKTLYALPPEAGTGPGHLPMVAGDYLFGAPTFNSNQGCVKLTPAGAKTLWTVPIAGETGYAMSATHTFISDGGGTHVYDNESGKKLLTIPAAGGRTNHLFLADNRLFLQPEGRHSLQTFYMMDITDPAKGALRGDLWKPPHPTTTAYACMPIGYPVVDGRLFVRGNAGIYCYDLRKVVR